MHATTRRLVPLLGALSLPLLASAQTTPQTPQTPAGPAGSSTSPGTVATVTPARFADLTTVPPPVASTAQIVGNLAEGIRLGIITLPTTNPGASSTTPAPVSPLTTAVTQANTAIIREGQSVRANALASRQASLTRLRLAQSETERLKLLEDLRLQSGERLEDQREAARLVRDRLRQVRDNAVITRPPAPTP